MIEFLVGSALRQESEIRQSFLKNVPSTPTALSLQDFRNIAAYLLISHSILEHHFENCARFLACASRNRFHASGHINRPLYVMALHYSKKLSTGPTISGIDSVGASVVGACAKHIEFLSDNHGIKAKNLAAICEPLGFDLRQHNVFVTDCEDFGGWRGSFAHKQIRAAVKRNGVDPRLHLARVAQLFSGLTQFSDDFRRFSMNELR